MTKKSQSLPQTQLHRQKHFLGLVGLGGHHSNQIHGRQEMVELLARLPVVMGIVVISTIKRTKIEVPTKQKM